LNVLILGRLPAWQALGSSHAPTDRERLQLAGIGGASLLSWLCAIIAGRMIGYW